MMTFKLLMCRIVKSASIFWFAFSIVIVATLKSLSANSHITVICHQSPLMIALSLDTR